jgi:hypothetical protein
MLQQLAWLGDDGTIHTVNQPSDMIVPIKGASAPMVGAWLNEDGEVETINDLQSLKLGAWLDEDNEVHTVNDLQNLRIGAWMGKDGEVHSVNDLQNLRHCEMGENSVECDLMNLNIGAWMGEDGDVHTVNDLQNLALAKAEVAQITMGILSGALHTESLDDYVTCIQDSDTVVKDVESAITNFEKKSISGVTSGISDLAAALGVIT